MTDDILCLATERDMELSRQNRVPMQRETQSPHRQPMHTIIGLLRPRCLQRGKHQSGQAGDVPGIVDPPMVSAVEGQSGLGQGAFHAKFLFQAEQACKLLFEVDVPLECGWQHHLVTLAIHAELIQVVLPPRT